MTDETRTRASTRARPTLGDVVRSDRRGVVLRRAATAALTLAVVAGGAGAAGIRQDQVVAVDGPLTLTVDFPGLARAGNDAVFAITVHSTDGLGDELELVLDRRYLDLWESQRFYPEPAQETADGDLVHLTFDTPPGGTSMTIRFDAYLQPVAQVGADGTVEASVDGHVATARFTTVMVP